MGVPLVQQMPKVRHHVPGNSFEFIWVHVIGVQPLQVQDVLLTVSQLIGQDRSSISLLCPGEKADL